MGSQEEPQPEMFTLLTQGLRASAPRLGRLSLPSRKVLDTPHYLAITSRGAVPHISPDTFVRDTSISGVYVGLEDFIERSPEHIPPLLAFSPTDGSSSLRRFSAWPDDTLLVLGARRTPPVKAPSANPNTNNTVSVCTSVGFRPLNSAEYAEAAEKIQADVVVGLADIPYGRALGSKRMEKAVDRSIDWLSHHVSLRKQQAKNAAESLFCASLLPVSCARQQFYIDCLNDHPTGVSGLGIYDRETLEDLPNNMEHLLRLDLTEPDTPHDILANITTGIDITVIPFIGFATDAGIALSFTFPSPKGVIVQPSEPLSLGVDMWMESHATDMSPLSVGCTCYACTNHHRAFLQHLLAAKEMLGWVLLQIHNHHVIDLFFASIRKSIAAGTFEQDVDTFARIYDSQLPEKTGRGPRVRGYQFKSEGPGESKKNTAPFNNLNDAKERLAEATPPNPNLDAKDLVAQGFAEKNN